MKENEISAEVAELLQIYINAQADFLSKSTVIKIIHDHTVQEKTLRWGIGKLLHWDGLCSSDELVRVLDTNPDIPRSYYIGEAEGHPLCDVYTTGHWVSESSLSEIPETEKEPLDGMPDEIYLSDIVEERCNGLWNGENVLGFSVKYYRSRDGISITEPVPKPEFKAADFVCFKNDKDHRIYRTGSGDGWAKGIISVYDYITEDMIAAEMTKLRQATDADWIVDEDGTEWKAEWEKISGFKKIMIYANNWLLFDDNNVKWHNQIAASICKDKNIPIKPCHDNVSLI
ncbi:hypothetical protein LCGC14_0758090 [marine sediment metagenome]|uniref:Uncharacterized protein n=1 Tax=marine sediment metagenome TaxID=412755 RepID=A0A0F9QLU0_9ZZZZ